MALKVKAQEKLQKIGTHAGKYRYIMMPELYTSLSQEKVIKEAALLNQPLSPTPARGFLLFFRRNRATYQKNMYLCREKIKKAELCQIKKLRNLTKRFVVVWS